MVLMNSCDVAVIGAGAAGLAAASRLAAAGRSVLLLEARDRVGGRAHTVQARGGEPIDLGCEWLHSADRNPLVPLFEAAGVAIDRTRPRWDEQEGDRGFPPLDQKAFAAAFDAFEERLDEAARDGREGAAADHFDPACRWNALMDAVSSYYNGTEFDRVSVLDYAAYVDTGVNWRLTMGYGTALAALAGSLGLEVVAEGVETPEQLAVLRELGCDFGQGYLWSRPVGPSEALSWALDRAPGSPPS